MAIWGDSFSTARNLLEALKVIHMSHDSVCFINQNYKPEVHVEIETRKMPSSTSGRDLPRPYQTADLLFLTSQSLITILCLTVFMQMKLGPASHMDRNSEYPFWQLGKHVE